MGSASLRAGSHRRLRSLALALPLLLAACAGAEGPRPVVVENDLFDPNPSRRVAAVAMVSETREGQWIPRLVELLDDADPAVRALANQTLEGLTGRRTPYAAYAPADERRPHVEAWRAWLAEERARVNGPSQVAQPPVDSPDATPWSAPRVDAPGPAGGR